MNLLTRLTFFTLLTLLFSFFYQSAVAQQPTPNDTLRQPVADSLLRVPTETKNRPPYVLFDSLNYRFIGDGNFTRGNINRTLLVTRAELMLAGPVLSLTTHPRFAYGQQNHILAERDGYLDLFLDIYKEKRLYGFGLATLENSNLRGINLRQLAGAGLGLRLLKAQNHSLSVTNAVIFESTNFRDRATITTQRNSTRLKGKHSFLQDKIRFNHITFVQPAINDISNLRWNTILSLELPLNKWVSMRAGYENSYESVVEANRKNNDSRLTLGIALGNRP